MDAHVWVTRKMKLSRRQVLLATGATVLPVFLFGATTQVTLQPGPTVAKIGQHRLEMLGFNGSVPGPEIRLRQNEKLNVQVENGLDDGTLVHWHGIRLPNAMDGVNVLTQDPIAPGDVFNYRFSVPDAGTYWYHSHYLSYDQVSRGLFGPLIVEESVPPDVDRDITVMLFDVLLDDSGNFDDEFRPEHFATAGRLGGVVTAFVSENEVLLGDRVRLRLINPSLDRVYSVSISGVSGFLVAYDGMPFARPEPLSTLVLAPGQRADIIADVTHKIAILETSGARGIEMAQIAVSGQRKKRSRAISALPANAHPRLGAIKHKAKLVMQGGAGGKSHSGTATWAFNNQSGLPSKPLISARKGDTVQIKLVNDTAFAHGIHLHGHHFWEVSEQGERTYFRDTTLVEAGDTRDIICVLDNPGAWLLHCHMLSHQADGMATWLRVR
ncbi:MAG: multicopper oxidase family protein [Halocynthiibacter sp.]